MIRPAIICALLFASTAAAQFRDLGAITINSGLQWENPAVVVTNRVYVGNPASTNYLHFATLTTNKWPGDATKLLHGTFNLYVTSVDNQGRESDPSEKVQVLFRAGIPVPPSNIQIYTVVTAAATNRALGVVPLPPMP